MLPWRRSDRTVHRWSILFLDLTACEPSSLHKCLFRFRQLGIHCAEQSSSIVCSESRLRDPFDAALRFCSSAAAFVGHCQINLPWPASCSRRPCRRRRRRATTSSCRRASPASAATCQGRRRRAGSSTGRSRARSGAPRRRLGRRVPSCGGRPWRTSSWPRAPPPGGGSSSSSSWRRSATTRGATRSTSNRAPPSSDDLPRPAERRGRCTPWRDELMAARTAMNRGARSEASRRCEVDSVPTYRPCKIKAKSPALVMVVSPSFTEGIVASCRVIYAVCSKQQASTNVNLL
jgi:hypothetical protein